MEEYDVNLSNSECIQEVDHMGYTTYHNICSDTSTDLKWGVSDWLATSLIVSIILLLVTFIVVNVKDFFFKQW